MNKRKNKGITIIALTITIIILLIIASVTISIGLNSLKDSKENLKLSELNMVQQAVLENYTKYKTTKNEMYILGKEKNRIKVAYSDMQNLINEINSQKTTSENIELKVTNYTSETLDISMYYYELSQEDLEEIGISNTDETYIVNFSTGEVINKTLLVTGKGTPLYTYSIDLR